MGARVECSRSGEVQGVVNDSTCLEVCSLIQAVPPFLIITKEPKSKACSLKGGMGHTIHSAKSLKGCGPLTWVKSILKKYHSPAIGETKYILPTAVVFPARRLHCACTCRLATPGSQR